MLTITDFGADGRGTADDTPAFERAFHAVEASGGETLTVPRGVYRTGPLDLPGGLDLVLEEGAFVGFIPDFSLYEPVQTRWEGTECWGFHPLIFASGKKDIRIRGKGIFDGSGQQWWEAYRSVRLDGRRTPATELELALARLNPGFEHHSSGGGGRELQFLRPPLLQFIGCEHVEVSGVTLQNSPFWNTHPVYCKNIIFDHVTFRNPSDAPNTDGLDIDSCDHVIVRHCLFDVGDDCLALKSGAGEDGVRVNKPCENITIEDCTMLAGHGGIVIGSETAGGIRNVRVHGCTMRNTDRGIRIKTRRGRGGVIDNLEFVGIRIHGCKSPVVINSFYRCGADPGDTKLFSLEPRPVEPQTPAIRKVFIRDLHADGVRSSAGFISGLPEEPITGLYLEHCTIELAPEDEREDPNDTAMSAGIPPTDSRALRVLFSERPVLNNVSVVDVVAEKTPRQ